MEINRPSDPIFFIISEKCRSSSQSRVRPVSSRAQTLFHTLVMKDKYHLLCLAGQVHEAELERWIDGKGLRTGLKRARMGDRRKGVTQGYLQQSWVTPVALGDPCGPGWPPWSCDVFQLCSRHRPHLNVHLHACYWSLVKSMSPTDCRILVLENNFEDSLCFGVGPPGS